jgi:hypothetical protein
MAVPDPVRIQGDYDNNTAASEMPFGSWHQMKYHQAEYFGSVKAL